MKGRRAGARRRRAGASTHGHLVRAQLGHVPSEQLQLLVALVVLLAQVLVLRFQVPQLVGDPFLDARRFGLDHFGILKSQLTLRTRRIRIRLLQTIVDHVKLSFRLRRVFYAALRGAESHSSHGIINIICYTRNAGFRLGSALISGAVLITIVR